MPAQHATPPRRARDQQRRRPGQRRPRQEPDPQRRAERVAARRRMLPEKINYPPELPVVERRQDIAEAVRDHQVVIVAG
ncbi:MAG: hypothetical protein GX555_10670, partial [Actinomycetales bacterium]|nr:hypothetical protein [Actinomycetales bacterium]